MKDKEVRIFNDIEEIGLFLLPYVKKIILSAIDNKGICTIVLSGGNTPLKFYKELSEDFDLNWTKIHFFMADERFVKPGNKDHNFTNISNVIAGNINPLNFHPIKTDTLSASESAIIYRKDLKYFFKNKLPMFDLVFLGTGIDGHTASLFPGTSSLDEKEHFAVSLKPPGALHDRITLTFPVLNNAENIIFLVAGSEKADIMYKILVEKNNLPAALINPVKGRLIFVLDKESAGALT